MRHKHRDDDMDLSAGGSGSYMLKRVLSAPGAIALLLTALFYIIVLGVLHPGYAINDDIKIIAIAAGYPGVQPSPFLIFSNVLLGLALVPLHQLPSPLNWEILLFVLANAASIWTLLYLVAAAPAGRSYRAVGAILVLACASYYGLNITFSSTAALACFAGLCALLGSAAKFRGNSSALAAVGIALVFVGSLVRIQMLLLTLPPVALAALLLYPTLSLRRAGIALGCVGVLVFGGYAFDRLYVRAHPEWNAFYFYNQTAMQIQDSHRLENMHLEIRRIGWSGNDQELFARYFFPDAGTYSIERLQYLVGRISGIGQNPRYTAGAFLQRLTSEPSAPPLLILAAGMFLVLSVGASTPRKLAIPLIAAGVLAENLAIMFVYKNPNYVYLSSLANAACLGVLVLIWPASQETGGQSPISGKRLAVVAAACGVIAAALAVAGSVRLALLTSGDNLGKQAGYARILADIDDLRRHGTVPEDAVLLSTSHGIPWEWSNPLLVGFPGFTYLDTGWNTFSPYYEEAIRKHRVEPVLDALLEGKRVYMVSKSIFKEYLARYYEEHRGISVTFETMYLLPNPNHYDGYDGVELYGIVPANQTLP